MKMTVTIRTNEDEEILLFVHSLDSPVISMLQPLADLKPAFFTDENGRKVKVAIPDILYFEAVDKKTFVYLNDAVYETPDRLYQIEEKYQRFDFCRVSKSVVLNLKKIAKIYPVFSGKFEVLLDNEEKLSISRSYVKALKQQLAKGGHA